MRAVIELRTAPEEVDGWEDDAVLPPVDQVPPRRAPDADRLPALRPPITAIRWGTLAVGLALALGSNARGSRLGVAAAVLAAYAVYRSVRPIAHRDEVQVRSVVVAEVALHVLAVTATGYWDSPFVFSLITAIIVAAFASGPSFAFRISLASLAAVALPYHSTTLEPVGDSGRRTAQWAVELLLVAAVAGYARRFSGEAEERHILALDRLGRLAQANTLLYSLHHVTQGLPASLDLEDVLDSTVTRLRTFYDLSALAVLVPDDTTSSWLVARQEGARLPAVVTVDELPDGVRQVIATSAAVVHAELDAVRGGGLAARSRAGLYAPLHARGQLVGVLALEHDQPGRLTDIDQHLLDGFTEAAALAIDNARWFARLRTVGADEERTRIARELHDRVGQSLAYVAFEIDRLHRGCPDEVVAAGLDQLRSDLRMVIGEIRDTLYDLRTDVSEEHGLVDIVRQFGDRVRARTGARVTVVVGQDGRLPVLQEREVWRIVQEAVVNAERHGEAEDVTVTWTCDGHRAELEVLDNGKGFETARAGRLDSYGIQGMRERAASIGASLTIESIPGRGTSVRCTLDPSEDPR